MWPLSGGYGFFKTAMSIANVQDQHPDADDCVIWTRGDDPIEGRDIMGVASGGAELERRPGNSQRKSRRQR
jgi:hypothetical protein